MFPDFVHVSASFDGPSYMRIGLVVLLLRLAFRKCLRNVGSIRFALGSCCGCGAIMLVFGSLFSVHQTLAKHGC